MTAFQLAAARAAKRAKRGPADIAKRGGLHATTVYDLLAGRQPNPGVTTAAALAKGIGCGLAALLPKTRRGMPNGAPPLVAAREAAGLSLRAAAELMGCGLRYLSEAERGKREPSISFILRAADAYRVDPSALAVALVKAHGVHS